MRILIVPSWYPTPSKPVNGVFIREQADALSKEHEVRVLYLDVLPRGSRVKPRRIVKQDRGYIEETIEVPNYPLLWQFAYLFRMARTLRRLRRTFKPDVVHCHIAVPAGWGVVMLRHLIGVPVVLTEHSSEFDSWMTRPGLRWMARRAYAMADMVIAVGEGQRQRIEKVFRRKNGLVAVPNVVDTDRFILTGQPDVTKGYRLLFVGLLDTNQKGLQVLLDALARMAEENSLPIPLHTDIVGDGILRVKYEEQVRQLRLDNVTKFHGVQSRETVAELMRESNALVLPSLHEALPVVIIEALVSGRPVISTRCGGPEYMIDNTTGRIVEPGQPAPLVNAIADVLTHLEKYDPQRLADEATSRYSYEAVTNTLTSIYEQLLAKESRSGWSKKT
jgi:glycosyltransferase involved in cell wall biosynthesis